MSSKKGGTTTIHRDTNTGRIVPAREVVRHPNTTVTEHYPPGHNRPGVTIHRDSGSGHFVPPSEVLRRPGATVTEHYRKK